MPDGGAGATGVGCTAAGPSTALRAVPLPRTSRGRTESPRAVRMIQHAISLRLALRRERITTYFPQFSGGSLSL